MVMYAPQVGLSLTVSPSTTTVTGSSASPSVTILTPDAVRARERRQPSQTALNCTVQTDRTSGMRRLNSSKQPHEPLLDRPCVREGGRGRERGGEKEEEEAGERERKRMCVCCVCA